MKRIDRFDPVRSRTFEEAERHYVEIHHRFAREMYRRDDSVVLQYIANRALRQYDVNGNFGQTPKAWRYVIQEVSEGLHQANSFISEWAREIIWRDHLNCIRNIKAYDVEAETILDRRSGQMSFAKYVFEYHRKDDVSIEDCDRYYTGEHLPALRECLDKAYGVRLMITNRVLREAETKPFEEEGQIITGDYLPSSGTYRFEEYWFDNDGWGGDFFKQDAIRRLLYSPFFATMEGYLVEQRCGVDKLAEVKAAATGE